MNNSLLIIAIILAATTLTQGYPQKQEAMVQPGKARLMVAGGKYREEGSEIIEVIDIEDENLVCDNLPDFPIKSMFGGMGGLIGGIPVICGGADAERRDGDVYDQCYSYDKTQGLWKPFAQLDGPRSGGLSQTVDGKLWIMGGVNKSAGSPKYPVRESVFIFENGTTQEGMKMPTDLSSYRDCSAQLENGKILVIPASASSRSVGINYTYIVDPLTNEISSGPTLPRNISNCNAIGFRSPAHGGRHVIAMLNFAWKTGRSGFFDILDYTMETTTWETQQASSDTIGMLQLTDREGSPTQLLSAPSGDGFIALAGPEGSLKRVFQFKCTLDGCEWTEKIQRLKEYHWGPVSMYIPNSMTNCRQKTQEEMQLDTLVKELLEKRIELQNERFVLREKEQTIQKEIEALDDAIPEISRKLIELGECRNTYPCF